jgi:hypothetical protein
MSPAGGGWGWRIIKLPGIFFFDKNFLNYLLIFDVIIILKHHKNPPPLIPPPAGDIFKLLFFNRIEL